MSRSKKTIKKYIEQFFLMAGSTILIVMVLIIALNFSKDAKIFAKKIAPQKKAVATQLPQNTGGSDEYDTLKYTREHYNSDDGEKDKHAKTRIEIINYSGDNKLPSIVKATLKNAGYSNIVINTANTADKKAGEGTNSAKGDDNTKSTAKPDSVNTPSSTMESEVVNTPVSEAEALAHYTPSAVPTNADTTPLPSGIESSGETGRSNREEAVDNKVEQNINIIDETQIIERNDKKLGTDIKKIIKVGKIIKKIDSKYSYDVTIILGTDFNP